MAVKPLTVSPPEPNDSLSAGARVVRIKFRDEALRRQVVVGHALSRGKYRVLGPLSNMPEFYQAFDVQPGWIPMYRDEDVRIKIV